MKVDAPCIELAAQGDRAAQRMIYDSLVGRVYRSVLRIVGPGDAEDVTQEVFLRLFAKLGSFRHDSEFTTWVYRLAVNEALQHLRRLRRRATVPLEEDTLPAPEQPDADLGELLGVALAQIDAELRMVLELKEIEQLSYAEIAELLGIPAGTVGSRLNRARHDLREKLIALGWKGEI
jgi:RNA polymerase sigma-70 factor (ECF subfamily)